MGNDFMQYPTTVKMLADEIKRACTAYTSRQIDNDRIREIIFWYANAMPDKLFYGADLNPTISKIIGKKRLRLINDMLDGYQHQLSGGR